MAAAAITTGGAIYSQDQANKAAAKGGTPQYISDADKVAIGKAETIGNQTYSPYTGQRVAGSTGNEQAGYALANGPATTQAQSQLTKAGSAIDTVAGNNWNSDTAQKYMNPYVSGVVDTALRKENQAYGSQLSQIGSNAASSGAYGGDRQAIQESQLGQKHLQTTGDITTQGYSDAYDKAMQGWQADNSRQLSAANAYANVGGDINKLNNDQITNLMQTGQAARVVQQAGLDFNYQQWTENRDWNTRNLQPLLSTLQSVRGVAGQPVANTANVAGEILGAGAAAIGYYGSRSSSNDGNGATSPAGYTPGATVQGSDGYTTNNP